MNNPEQSAMAAKPGPGNGSSPLNAAPLGKMVKTTVERGHAYMVPRLYNVEITVLEVIRGQAANEPAGRAVQASSPLKPGYEYLLARLKFGYFERGRISGKGASDTGEAQHVSFGGGSVDVTYTLAEGQLMAVSISGETEYELPQLSRQPEPNLTGWEFHPGETREGWILFQAPQDNRKPLLIFKREHVEGMYGIWGYVWFQLYE
jgi:hypothetical protein